MIAKGILNIISVILLQGTSFIIGIWAAKLMSKGEFGSLQFLRTILSYSAFTTLGVTQAVLFELPIALGKGDAGEVQAIQRLFNSLLMASGLIALLLSGVLSLLHVPLNGISLTWEWLWFGIVLSISGWTGYSQILFLSYQQFGKLGTFRLIYPVCFALTTVVLLPLYKINGFLASMAIGYGVLAGYGLYAHRATLGIFWDTKRFWHYVRIGLPIRLNTFVWLLMTTIALWFVSLFIGSESAGVYGFAMMVSAAYGLIPGIISEMGMPRISTLFGRSYLDPKPLANPAIHSLRAFAGLNVLPAILALMAFDIIITYWVPKYRDSELIMLFLVIGYYVNSVCALAGNILILLRRQRVMLMASIVILMTVILAAYCAATFLGTAAAVGAATMLGLCLNGVTTLAFIVRVIRIEKQTLFLTRLGVEVLFGICAIVASWAVAQHFSNWQKIIMFVFSGVCFSGFHTFAGIKEIRLFWRITQVVTPVATAIQMLEKEEPAQ